MQKEQTPRVVKVYNGINIYNSEPNEYHYTYKYQIRPGLYYSSGNNNHNTNQTSEHVQPIYPVTNRKLGNSYDCHSPQVYVSLITSENLEKCHGRFYSSSY